MRLPIDFPEPTVYAVPFFVITLFVEAAVLRRQQALGREVIGFEARDTRASLLLGVGSLFTSFAFNTLLYTLAHALYQHRWLSLGHGWLGWLVALVGWDFSFYWHHRFEHEVRLLWACHVNHHSSQHYNLSTALRQPWTPWPVIFWFAPWALLGVEPWLIMVSGGLNLVYQYWIHTEAIGRLPRVLEWVLNTPSHHRVHHGANPQYLDKNYGGVLILWDRLFGTFEAEHERVVYGLTKNLDTFSVWRIAFHEYAAIARDLRRVRGWRERLGVVFRGPEWRAPSLREH